MSLPAGDSIQLITPSNLPTLELANLPPLRSKIRYLLLDWKHLLYGFGSVRADKPRQTILHLSQLLLLQNSKYYRGDDEKTA